MTHEKYYLHDSSNIIHNNNSTEDSINDSDMYQNLISYELQRCSVSGGFGFDLKGDRPAVVHSIRKGSKAELAGLQVGDLVITINNKKVTELDHDQVVCIHVSNIFINI
jgi:C-terminal processing protease CtpA/Prc